MFNKLQKINACPKPFEFYTAEELWNDEHTSEQMLGYHLNEAIDVSSRRKEFLDSSVKWIASRFNIGPKTRIADFGCGPGLYTTRFARLGAHVTGIDFSKRSIEYAKKTAIEESLEITYINGNYLDCTLEGTYDLITMIMCDFCALSPEQRSRLLARFAEHLVSGGSVLFDVNSLAAFNKRKEAATYELNQLNGFWAKEDYYGFVNTFKYDTEK
jgi:SAM-dependent methyltransferase